MRIQIQSGDEPLKFVKVISFYHFSDDKKNSLRSVLTDALSRPKQDIHPFNSPDIAYGRDQSGVFGNTERGPERRIRGRLVHFCKVNAIIKSKYVLWIDAICLNTALTNLF